MTQSRYAARATALQDSMTIGIAAGLVMSRSKVSPEEAEELLKAAAGRTGRSLAAVSRTYIDTGQA